MSREKLHILLLGKAGAGKSTLVSTFEKPMLVMLTDPPGKERPYCDRGIATDIQLGPFCYYRDVMSKTDPERRIIRVEFWGEPNPAQPQTFPRFVARMAQLEQEIAKEGYKTVALDTATYFELMARYYSMNGQNRDVKDGRQHYAFSTNQCEQYIMMRWPNLLLCNSIVLAHIDDQKDESDSGEGVVMRKMAALPGKLPNRLPGGFGEVWRVYVDENGQRVLQTQQRAGSTFDCKSLMKVPDGTYPHYEAIWKALEEQNGSKESVS